MSAVLEVKSLRKEFGDLIAVDGISFEIQEGEIFGFLGPNGAGKTTSISMICGLLKPTAGEILVEGISILKNPREVKRRLGRGAPGSGDLRGTVGAREPVVLGRDLRHARAAS